MGAEPYTAAGGKPWYSPLAILTALTLRAMLRLALRQTEGLIGSIIHLLGLALAVLGHSTLSRRAGTLKVPRLRPHTGSGPLHMLVGARATAPASPVHATRQRHARWPSDREAVQNGHVFTEHAIC